MSLGDTIMKATMDNLPQNKQLVHDKDCVDHCVQILSNVKII